MTTYLPRDRWLAATLPALLTLLIGWLAFIRPASNENAKILQRVESQGPLEARKALVTRAQADREVLEKSIAAKRGNSASDESVFDRNWAMQQISLLCGVHGLSLEKSAPDPAAQLSPALKDALPAFSARGTAPQVWRLEFSGAYPNVVKLLDGLQQAKPLVVPLNLSMQTGKSERRPASWVLTLWL